MTTWTAVVTERDEKLDTLAKDWFGVDHWEDLDWSEILEMTGKAGK